MGKNKYDNTLRVWYRTILVDNLIQQIPNLFQRGASFSYSLILLRGLIFFANKKEKEARNTLSYEYKSYELDFKFKSVANDKNHGGNATRVETRENERKCMFGRGKIWKFFSDCRRGLKGMERGSGYWTEKNRERERGRGETDNPEFWGWIERVNMAARSLERMTRRRWELSGYTSGCLANLVVYFRFYF